MTDVNLSDAREHLSSLVTQAIESKTPVFLARRGCRVAALIDSEVLDHVLELAEDMEDILDAQAAREEMRATGEEMIPWEQVKADLGMV